MTAANKLPRLDPWLLADPVLINQAFDALDGGTSGKVTIVGGTFETSVDVLTIGGFLANSSGIKIVSDGSNFPVGQVTWFANVNGQFLAAQYFPYGSGYMPVDASTAATFRFEVVSDIQRLVQAKFSVYVDTYKFAKQTASAATTPATVTSLVSAGGGSHAHDLTLLVGTGAGAVTADGSGAHGVTLRAGANDGTISTSAVAFDNLHTHDVAGSSHTHNLNDPSVLVSVGAISSISSVVIKKPDGTTVATLGPYTLSPGQSQNGVDITTYLRNADWTPVATGWWTVSILANALGAIQAQVNVKATVQAI